MVEHADATRRIQAALEHEPAVNLHHSPIHIRFADGCAALEGEVDSIAAKRVAVYTVGRLPFVDRVDDRLVVRPGEARDDGAIKDGLILAFQTESAFQRCAISVRWHDQRQSVADSEGDDACRLDIAVCDGTVVLRGEVWSLSHKRLAEALCWWTPGVRNVDDAVAVRPGEQDGDAEINDAIALVLAKDPLVGGEQLLVSTRNRTVTLRGTVRAEQERQMAENDCWYLDGVEAVVNEVQVTG